MSFNQRQQDTSDSFSRAAAAANVSDGRPVAEPVPADQGNRIPAVGDPCAYCGAARGLQDAVHDPDAPHCVYCGAATRYRVEYVTRRGDGWASNALTFDTFEDAEQEARDRSFRWTAVKLARVVPTSTPDRQPCDYDDPGPVVVVDYR